MRISSTTLLLRARQISTKFGIRTRCYDPLTRPGLLTILLSARFASPLFAQAETTIPETEAAQQVGQHVTVDEREKG
jgi:hypothetical protein